MNWCIYTSMYLRQIKTIIFLVVFYIHRNAVIFRVVLIWVENTVTYGKRTLRNDLSKAIHRQHWDAISRVHGWRCFWQWEKNQRGSKKERISSPSLAVTWLLFTPQHELCDWLLGGLTAWMALGRKKKKQAEIILWKNKDVKKGS